MPENTVGKLSSIDSSFTSCQLSIVDQVVEFLQKRLKLADKRIEMGTTIQFCEVVIA